MKNVLILVASFFLFISCNTVPDMEEVTSSQTGDFNVFLNCSKTLPNGVTVTLKEYHSVDMYTGEKGVYFTYWVTDNSQAGVEWVRFKLPTALTYDNFSNPEKDKTLWSYKSTEGVEYAFMQYRNWLPTGTKGTFYIKWAASYNGYTSSNTRPRTTPEPWWKTTVTVKMKGSSTIQELVFGPVCQ